MKNIIVGIALLCLPAFGQIESYPPATGGSGGATSVGLSFPSTFCAVSGSPVTTAGTLTCTYATGQTANRIFGTDGSGNVGLMSLATAQLPIGIAFLANNQTFTGTNTISTAGAASTSPLLLSGALFTGGTGTTTFPYQYINQGSAPTTWSTLGTIFGINAPSGFAGSHIDIRVNGGASVFSVASTGQVTSATNFISGATTGFQANGRSRLVSPADGQWEMLNQATTGFTRLQFGGTTSSFPALNVNGANLEAKLSDSSAYTGFLTGVDATVARLTSALPTCIATTGTPWRASVTDAVSPTVGAALTGGGGTGVFANVHCSLTTGTYLVDGL